MELLWDTYWPLILIALVIGAIVGWLIFRPRQRVTLSDEVPLRPHMTAPPAAKGNEVAGPGRVGDPDVNALPAASGPADDLNRLKGVGPKMVAILAERGITRFDQLASLSPGQIESIDSSLGAFRGRFTRDRIVEQAQFLARGDVDGFEAKFGKL